MIFLRNEMEYGTEYRKMKHSKFEEFTHGTT
jgi:hypothetical protein